MSKAIGIDLGTGNSCVAVMEGGKPTVIVNSEGNRTTPSVVAFTAEGERKIGNAAKRQAITNAKNTVSSIKRYMGETYDEVKNEISNSSFEVTKNGDFPRVKINDKEYTPQEISSMILQNLKKSAEDYLGTEVKDAVITVPAYFSDSQRQATKEAGEIAGLNVLRIINEPTAAALAYGLDKQNKDSKIAVFDLGQGTFDISILSLGDGIFEVLSTNGNTHLGGDDFDKKIIDWIAEDFQKENSVDVRKDSMALQRLKEAAEKAKIELSNQTSTEINLPYLFPVDGVPKHFVKTLTRAKFNDLTSDLVTKTLEPCKRAVKDAKVDYKDIDEVILVGGSTRIPAVQEAVKNLFGKEPNKSVNADEAVACGACIQADVLIGNSSSDILLLDVTPVSVGIKANFNEFVKIIEGNTTIPVEKSQIFTTAVDNQPAVDIEVYQGERLQADKNKLIGRFLLDGIVPQPAHIPQIEVKFSIDANGILTVMATDKGTGKEQHITIESSTKLSDDEIERMKKEAEEHAEEDKKIKEENDKINQAEGLTIAVEKAISEAGDKITDEDKESVKPSLEALKKAVSERNTADVEKYQQEVQTKWYPIAAKLYQGGSQDGDANPFGQAKP